MSECKTTLTKTYLKQFCYLLAGKFTSGPFYPTETSKHPAESSPKRIAALTVDTCGCCSMVSSTLSLESGDVRKVFTKSKFRYILGRQSFSWVHY